MINILIAPVDFSNEAITALKFAAELSKRTSAKLVLLHALGDATNEGEAKQKLSQLVTDLQKPVKLTPASRSKLTPSGRSKLTPVSRSKLTPLEEYFLGME
jgi:hypothetical protein